MLLNNEWKGTGKSLSSSPAFMPDVTMFSLFSVCDRHHFDQDSASWSASLLNRRDSPFCLSQQLSKQFANFAPFNLNHGFVTGLTLSLVLVREAQVIKPCVRKLHPDSNLRVFFSPHRVSRPVSPICL